MRMRIESMAGKNGTRQASVAGFETEDVLYLLPLVTLLNGMTPFLIAASIGAPVFAVWVLIDYQRIVRQGTKRVAPSKDAEGQDFQAVQ
jgi:hypothetical protein